MGIAISLLNVRRSILIQAPPERVWQEFESFEQISAWFGRGHDLHRFEAKLALAKDFVRDVAGPEALQLLTGSGLGNNEILIRDVVALAERRQAAAGGRA